MNENNPSNPFALLYYLNREQYGQRPLFHGPYYNAPVTDYVKGKPTYNPIDGKYVITNRETIREYDERFMTLLPEDVERLTLTTSGFMKSIPATRVSR
ncbi:MAG: hypothetical protein MZV63_70575 [Marinilabiliales bacterium]|nr:hypothetical protein [Marinilabiliales bacterium]